MSEQRRFYEFAGFRIDEGRRLLLRNGEAIALTSKTFDTLLALVRQPGKVLSKQQLMKDLWPATHVEEGNLAVNVSVLRKALGESRSDHRFILTVPGVGYRFVAAVEEVLEEGGSRVNGAAPAEPPPPPTKLPPPASAALRPSAHFFWVALLLLASAAFAGYRLAGHPAGDPPAPGPEAPVRSLAVLPFQPLVANRRDEYLGLGMADALITKLSGVRQLIVRPTSAVLRYAGRPADPLAAGREQKVDAVLEGTIEREDESVRMRIRLLRVRDGSSLWSYQCDEAVCSNIFLLQDLVSEKIAEALLVEVTGAERTTLRKHYTENAAAYEAYVRGRYFWNERTSSGLRKAIEWFERAVAEDPNYALAYAGLADSYSLGVWYIPIPASEAVPKMTAAARRALELDDRLAEAHIAMANVHSFAWEWAEGIAEHRRAIQLNPGYATARHWFSLALALEGRIEEAIVEARKARELDPLSPSISADLGWVYYLGRRYDDAIRQYRSTLEANPDFSLAHFDLALAYSARGMHRQAVEEMSRASDRGSDYLAGLGFVCGSAGQRERAMRALKELETLSARKYVPPYHFAWVYVGLGERDRAIASLQRVYREHTQHVVDFKMSPMLDSLRGDSRFEDLVRRVGL
ncbi:MAG TPA: winged helix-turn-helix domain-containing protein [Thermoanaerobaculia bacterium]|nr:winged helix-turn-helix domain-containing protein [Thermoanaerobaculia bacterium]